MRAGPVSWMFAAVTTRDRTPWWLWPNLLSLDAPLVSLAWLYMLAKTWGINYHPEHEYLVLGLAVWAVYASDRLLDAWVHGDAMRCKPRHRFHWRHRWWFLGMIVLAAVTAAGVLLNYSPVAILRYGAVAGVMAFGYFSMALFVPPGEHGISHTKNLLGGFTFAFGTALVAHVYRFDRQMMDMVLHSREFVCFGVLCVLNISAIDLWEHASRTADENLRAQDELALSLPLMVLGGAAFMFARQAEGVGEGPYFHAVLISAALLFVINRIRNRFSVDALRVLADVALVLPVGIFLLSR